MKKFTIIIAILLISFFSKAQSYVTIPDSHFVHWLTAHIPSAMVGNQMDTSNIAVTSLTSINISSDTLCRLDGIQFFTSLQTLDCSYNSLDTLANLPLSLQTLICTGNTLIYLPGIPNSITFFSCDQNQLDSLPTLPLGLVHLDCNDNLLTSLPTLPSSLTYFDCSGNQLTSLPILPPVLANLNCAENQLTNLPALPSTITSINCENNLLTSLPVLPASLDTLNCGSNLLTGLPTLPSTLIDLECYYNQLTSLPILPGTLQTIVAGGNLLTSLPILPSSLILLKCYENQLTFLPVLPSSLSYLDCSLNLITSLPALSSSLNYLDCDDNQLAGLPTLTSSLQTLSCANNLLAVIPALPSSLIDLSCGYNPLINLPVLPSSLSTLDCKNATLDSLPALPSSLYYLDCSYNSLVSLPLSLGSVNELYCNNNLLTDLPILPPSLSYLICNNNNINCFREFSNSLAWIEIDNNPFTCLPNYIPTMDAPTLLYPLCVSGDLINNPHGCIGAKGIVGFTYTDMNSNCMKDSTDGNLANIPIRIYDSIGGFISQTYTASNGVYDFPQPAGTYTVIVDTIGLPISPQCATPGIDSTVSVTSTTPLATGVNFDFNCKPGFDVGVKSISNCGLVFPGQTHELRVYAGDMTQWYNMHCAAGMSGQVQMTITGPVSFSGITPGALMPIITGSIYTYPIADFGTIINSEAFGLILTVDPTAGSGNRICVHIDVTPAGGDNDTTNNSLDFCYVVVNSHDPNMKETYPDAVPLNYNDWFTYTIQFQNTGNAPAVNINLRDTLDSQLDLSTFQAIGYSHPNHVILNGNALMIQFPNIYLSDSTSSLDSSKGFFQYRIKPISGLGCGAQIHNTASIYFDFNSPIVTNTTINSYPQSPVSPMISDTSICHSGSLIFNVFSSGDTINWYDASHSLIHSGNTYTLSNVNASTVLYEQTVAPNGCSSPIETVNISVLPTVTSPLLSSGDTLCFTQTLSFSAASVAGWNYNWSGPSGFVSSLENPSITPPLSTNNSGTYSLFISNGQCVSDTAHVFIKVDSLPVLFVSNNLYICLGDSVLLFVTGNLNNFIWGTGETSQAIFVSPATTKLYWINGINTCGTTTQNILVTVNVLPIASAEDAVLISGESTQLHAAGGSIYSWYPMSGLSCSDCPDPITTITADQSYSIIVTDTNGCSDTTSLRVKVMEETNTVYIPNSFSPNGDGLNDEFKIAGKDIKNAQMIIYARSGDKIFESTDINTGWDGAYKGNIMSPLVYVYIINVTFNNGEEHKYKGTITLIR